MVSGRLGSVAISDERPLSGIGIQWRLSGDQSEERAVANRPIFAIRASPIAVSQPKPVSEHWRTRNQSFDLNQAAISGRMVLLANVCCFAYSRQLFGCETSLCWVVSLKRQLPYGLCRAKRGATVQIRASDDEPYKV